MSEAIQIVQKTVVYLAGLMTLYAALSAIAHLST